jgi:8-amino-3,8-dideoxy-alpha-D-manno-octulosonate transaminase
MPGNELIGSEELESIKEIFTKSGGVLFGHGFEARRNHIFRVRELERLAALRFEAKHCTAVSSGTAALYSALKALKIGPGDEVITQAYTFVATVEAIVELGATPIVVNIDNSLNMNPKELEKAITKRTKCIIPVHMQGNPARMTEILAIARKHAIPVIEDSCQAIGAKYKGKHCGTIADAGCFSLDFGKVITGGEGGFIFTNSDSIHKFVSTYVDHGHENNPQLPRGRDTAYVSGFNFRMSELQAAVLLAQLKKLDFMLGQMKKNKKYMKSKFMDRLGGKIEFRDITDPEELCDGVIFFLPNKQVTARIVQDLTEKKIWFKNVPDAMEWHCANFWGHIWKDHPIYRGTYKTAWQPSMDLLERCLSFSVNVLHKEEEMDALVNTVSDVILKHL